MAPFEARPAEGEVWVHLKVVPGASRDAVAGLLGDRLRVRVAAPPEGGRANRAVLDLLARHLGLAPSALRVVRGETSPHKTVAVRGPSVEDVRRGLLGARGS